MSIEINKDNIDQIVADALDVINKEPVRTGPMICWLKEGPTRDKVIKELKSAGYTVEIYPNYMTI